MCKRDKDPSVLNQKQGRNQLSKYLWEYGPKPAWSLWRMGSASPNGSQAAQWGFAALVWAGCEIYSPAIIRCNGKGISIKANTGGRESFYPPLEGKVHNSKKTAWKAYRVRTRRGSTPGRKRSAVLYMRQSLTDKMAVIPWLFQGLRTQGETMAGMVAGLVPVRKQWDQSRKATFRSWTFWRILNRCYRGRTDEQAHRRIHQLQYEQARGYEVEYISYPHNSYKCGTGNDGKTPMVKSVFEYIINPGIGHNPPTFLWWSNASWDWQSDGYIASEGKQNNRRGYKKGAQWQ